MAELGSTLEIGLVPFEHMANGRVWEEADLLLQELPVEEDEEWTLLTLLANSSSLIRRCLPPEREEALKRLLADLPSQPQRSDRLALLRQAERLVLLSYAVILWYRWRQSASFPPGLRGVAINSVGWVDYKHLWFAEPPSL
ncbi:hypothetical protein [Paenibacillus cremeus]|uniref:Uncharacterized protein n=1 Tax=Paenibacillus cremeus TaxID=2163881 RepID=A0A559K8J8_9BACL|nr:hypothetical protein [Paenibacillus cremeus]TVY08449.1 hypothetical protein FPZ49_18615 [Paenibacillus cremeus]